MVFTHGMFAAIAFVAFPLSIMAGGYVLWSLSQIFRALPNFNFPSFLALLGVALLLPSVSFSFSSAVSTEIIGRFEDRRFFGLPVLQLLFYGSRGFTLALLLCTGITHRIFFSCR